MTDFNFLVEKGLYVVEIYNRRSTARALPADFQRWRSAGKTPKGNTVIVLTITQTNLLNIIDFFRVLLIALLTRLSTMKGDRKAWNFSKIGCLPTLNGGTEPVLIQCRVDAWHYTNVSCLPTLRSDIATVLSQCCANV